MPASPKDTRYTSQSSAEPIRQSLQRCLELACDLGPFDRERLAAEARGVLGLLDTGRVAAADRRLLSLQTRVDEWARTERQTARVRLEAAQLEAA